MKEILTRNPGLKFLSLFIAFIIWLIIMNIEDPAIELRFDNIPVTVINEEALGSIDKIYSIVSGEEVDVVVKGKRSIVEGLSRTDFTVTADLEELSIVNAMEIKVTVPGYGDQVEIVKQSVSTMAISLEKLVTEQFRVDIVERGSVRGGYYINEKTASPNIIQVSGAESIISKIKEVVVDVNVSGADETFTINATPQVFDHNGTLMDSEKMQFNHEEFAITVTLLETKTVKLFIEIQGTAAMGFDYSSFEYEPKEVEIAGTGLELAKVPHILGTYNISGAREDIEDEVNINDFINNDIILIDEEQNAVVNIDIEPVETKEISFPTNRIKINNVPENKTVEILRSNALTVEVGGLQSEIEKVNLNNINPYIDLSAFEGNRGNISILFNSEDGKVTFSEVNIPIELHNKD